MFPPGLVTLYYSANSRYLSEIYLGEKLDANQTKFTGNTLLALQYLQRFA